MVKVNNSKESKEAKKAFIIPQVSNKDLMNARKLLDDKAEKMKQRTSLQYWLMKNKCKDLYDKSGMDSKKDFMERWFANKMAGNLGYGKKSQNSTQKISSMKETQCVWKWMCWEEMKMEFGEAKAKNKVDSGILEWRADPDTGLLDFHNKEWKVWVETGSNKEQDEHARTLSTEEELDAKAAEEAIAHFKDVQGQMAGNASAPSSSTDAVKKEPTEGTEAEQGQQEGKKDIGPEDLDEDEDKTLITLLRAPRQVLRKVGDTQTDLKEMLHATAGHKYCGLINADITKAIPRFGKLFTAVETVVLQPWALEDPDGPAPEIMTQLKALAKKVDDEFEEYNGVYEAYLNFFPPKPGPKKKQKVA